MPRRGFFLFKDVLSILSFSNPACKTDSIAWLDLKKNAFGSVPTNHLLRSMKELGLEGTTLEVVEDIYTNSTTQVRIGKEQTDSIPCEKGGETRMSAQPNSV